MCGKELPAIKDELHLLKSSSIKNPKVDQNELKSLKSEFCKNGYLQIMQMRGGALIWTWLKPILNGKVLYSPKNQMTDQIISEINNTFTSMESIISSLKTWTETAQSLKSFFNDKKIKSKLMDVQQFLPLVLGQGYENLFQDDETMDSIENLSRASGVINLIELLGNVAQCIEMNRFIGFDNELHLEQIAKKYTKTHNLIAGVVFMNLNQRNLPKKIKYKLRVDIDFVPGTKQLKDRIWEPGPKDHFDKDLGYFKGFVQLQEMIDHAIMKVQIKNLEQSKQHQDRRSNMSSNSTETEFNLDESPELRSINDANRSFLNLDLPPVYMQQFPYSCYKEDKFSFYILGMNMLKNSFKLRILIYLILALSPVISTVCWIFLIAFAIRDYVLERELHLEEILYVTGLKPSVRYIIFRKKNYFIDSVLKFLSLSL